MTDQQNQDNRSTASSKKDRFHDEFDALPLDEKISKLLRMEAVTLSETLAYVVQSPLKVVEKMGDVLSDIGAKIENQARTARTKAETGAGKAKQKRRSQAPPAPAEQ